MNEIGDGEEVNGDGKDERGEAVEEFEWDDLEERFLAKMEECRGVEEGIWQEFRGWVEVRFPFSFFSRIEPGVQACIWRVSFLPYGG